MQGEELVFGHPLKAPGHPGFIPEPRVRRRKRAREAAIARGGVLLPFWSGGGCFFKAKDGLSKQMFIHFFRPRRYPTSFKTFEK